MLSMLYEGLKGFREWLQRNKMRICGRYFKSSVHYEKATATTDLMTAPYGTIKKPPQ